MPTPRTVTDTLIYLIIRTGSLRKVFSVYIAHVGFKPVGRARYVKGIGIKWTSQKYDMHIFYMK